MPTAYLADDGQWLATEQAARRHCRRSSLTYQWYRIPTDRLELLEWLNANNVTLGKPRWGTSASAKVLAELYIQRADHAQAMTIIELCVWRIRELFREQAKAEAEAG